MPARVRKRARKVLVKVPARFHKSAGKVPAKEPARVRESATKGSEIILSGLETTCQPGAKKVPEKYSIYTGYLLHFGQRNASLPVPGRESQTFRKA